jgi:23S rRNA pseudouridine2605 synthase
MTLSEGKNREIKKLLERLGVQVTRLIRTAYGPFQLGELAQGAVEEVPVRLLHNLLPDYFA